MIRPPEVSGRMSKSCDFVAGPVAVRVRLGPSARRGSSHPNTPRATRLITRLGHALEVSSAFRLLLLLFFLGTWYSALSPSLVFAADPQSAHYVMSEAAFTGGGTSGQSAAYVVEQGTIDFVAKGAMSGTNYKVDGKVGVRTIPVPEIQTVTPGDYSRFFTDQSPSFTVSMKDPDSDTGIQYQLKVDNAVKAAFQSSNVLSYVLTAADKGRHALDFQVRDNSDGTVSARKYTYDFRRPVK